MSETCPHCEAPGRRDTYQVGDRHLSRWLCGASEHINGTILRSTECFENELGCVKEQLTAAQARIAELESQVEQMKAAKKQREDAAIRRVTDGIFPQELP